MTKSDTDNDTESMTDFMLSNSDDEPPRPEDTPFTDVTAKCHTNTWEPLYTSCRRAADRLEADGEATSDELSRLAEAPKGGRTMDWAGEYEAYFWRVVCPTLESHPRVRWNECYKFDPPGLSDDEWQEVASSFNIDASNSRGDHRRHYPDTIQSMYQTLRHTYNDDSPRHGVSEYELKRCGVQMAEHHHETCLTYVERFPDVIPPNRNGGPDRPDWEWIE